MLQSIITQPASHALEFGLYRDGDNNLDEVQEKTVEQAQALSARDSSIAFTVEDTTTHELNIPASTTVQYVSGHSASTGGNLLVLEEIAAETYTSAGVLKIIGNRYDLLAVA